ncbi:MAG: zinc-finger domain-containing protein [Alphaproteobacteria bacterium]|nr:zinc-finger domain-containing protein [Alphaproteobacteria bacterium]
MTSPSSSAPISADQHLSERTPDVIAVDPHCSGVKCDGGGGALGHPVVYYVFDGRDHVECQYCDRIFVRR